jgi:hypothetical protein
MTDPSVPNLARFTTIHGVIVEGDEVIVQGATKDQEWADIRMPIREARKLEEYLGAIPGPLGC